MPDKPDLDGAYALASQDAIRDLYADWADSYDAAFAAARGYALHSHVAAAFVARGGSGPVLDVGAGTGLVGEVLVEHGVGPVDGMDLSQEMLTVAAG
ncbi:MAG: methyltransferase, partial [Pseudomonadota bacterium]